MAESPSHKFGQIIGNIVEHTLYASLKSLADKHGLYLDYKHPRTARNGRSKVSWIDNQGNSHDLDYVLEKDGSEQKIGTPRAFIETAWRRYTKHSKNKAQEMQGAILPLAERYSGVSPFLGVVLAGVFTEASLHQLRSHGFSVLYYPYEAIIGAFLIVGIDVEFNERTSDEEFSKKIDAYQKLGEAQKTKLVNTLLESRKQELSIFMKQLEDSLKRNVVRILVLALHGVNSVLTCVEDAVTFIEHYKQLQNKSDLVRFEIEVHYSNSDSIRCQFSEKRTAIIFLKSLGQ